MSAIPPNPIASVLQSGITQAEQARESDAAKNAQRDQARRITGGPDAILEVEGTDTDDTQVHTDSGGTGGQGRHDAPPREQAAAEEAAEEDITIDENGVPHVDLRA